MKVWKIGWDGWIFFFWCVWVYCIFIFKVQVQEYYRVKSRKQQQNVIPHISCALFQCFIYCSDRSKWSHAYDMPTLLNWIQKHWKFKKKFRVGPNFRVGWVMPNQQFIYFLAVSSPCTTIPPHPLHMGWSPPSTSNKICQLTHQIRHQHEQGCSPRSLRGTHIEICSPFYHQHA